MSDEQLACILFAAPFAIVCAFGLVAHTISFICFRRFP